MTAPNDSTGAREAQDSTPPTAEVVAAPPSSVTCPDCGGKGHYENCDLPVCPYCRVKSPCVTCDGSGTILDGRPWPDEAELRELDIWKAVTTLRRLAPTLLSPAAEAI